MPMSEQQLKEAMLALIPADGTSISNKALRTSWIDAAAAQQTNVSVDDYWRIRELLLESESVDTGRGKGGSVHRVLEEVLTPDNVAEEAKQLTQREIDLYDPLIETLRKSFTKDYGIKKFVCEKTAMQGRRKTGGKWTRPDISLVAVQHFEFFSPSTLLEVITFEVKPLSYFGVDGAFEAAAHSVFAHRSFLLVQVPANFASTEEFDRLTSECRRFGVTLMTFADANDYDTFTLTYEADLNNPSPAAVEHFIAKQFSTEQRQALHALIAG